MPGSQFESCFHISAADGLTRIWAMESERFRNGELIIWCGGEVKEKKGSRESSRLL